MFYEEFLKVITEYQRETVRKEVISKSYKEFRKVLTGYQRETVRKNAISNSKFVTIFLI